MLQDRPDGELVCVKVHNIARRACAGHLRGGAACTISLGRGAEAGRGGCSAGTGA